MLKNLSDDAGDKKHRFNPWVRKIPLEEGMATHFSIFAWEIPWTEELGGLQSMGSHRVGPAGSDLACTHYFSCRGVYISMLHSQLAPPSPSSTVSASPFSARFVSSIFLDSMYVLIYDTCLSFSD